MILIRWSPMIAVRLPLLLALGLSLSACGGSSRPPGSVPAPLASLDLTGTWRGSSTRFQADMRACPHPGLVTLRVLDGKFQYRWDANTWIDAAIDPDGTVHGEGPGITLIGKRADKRIEGDVTNGYCGLHFTVAKQDT